MSSRGLLLLVFVTEVLIAAVFGGFGTGPQAAVFAVMTLGAMVLAVEALWGDR